MLALHACKSSHHRPPYAQDTTQRDTRHDTIHLVSWTKAIVEHLHLDLAIVLGVHGFLVGLAYDTFAFLRAHCQTPG